MSEPRTRDDATELVAQLVYDAMCWTVANPPFGRHPPDWQPGGNSDAQDRARKVARAAIAALVPEPIAFGRLVDPCKMGGDHVWGKEANNKYMKRCIKCRLLQQLGTNETAPSAIATPQPDAERLMKLAEAWADAARNPYIHNSHKPAQDRARAAEASAKAAFRAALSAPGSLDKPPEKRG